MSESPTPEGGTDGDPALDDREASLAATGAAQSDGSSPTVVAVGTSVMWATGNRYEHKFPNLVHKDLTGGYPLDEKFLHYRQGPTPPGDGSAPTPSYYRKTRQAVSGGTHPKGDPLPPKQYRARGGAIIGLSRPAPVLFGDQTLSDRPSTDADAAGGGNNYLAKNAEGSYYGKLDYFNFRGYAYSGKFDPDKINQSKWLIARDIGWAWPTIPDQIEQFDRDQPSTVDVPDGDIARFGGIPDDTAPAGKDVDVVLLDGGTNDLTLGWLNDPRKATRSTIRQAVRRYMYRDMKLLIDRARSTFPNAVIVVLGYPVWASNRTDVLRAKQLLLSRNAAAALPNIVEAAFDNVLNFARFQAYWLRRSVAEKHRTDPGPGIVIAPPGYGVVNGMMADWPWSFGYDPDPNGFDIGITTDETRDLRYEICKAEYDAEHPCEGGICPGYDPRTEVSKFSCYNAPIGHPNPEGCRQYADTIIRRYKRHIDRDIRSVADELDDGTSSVRGSLERYGLGPDGEGLRGSLSGRTVGLAWAASHRVVDSIRAELTTGDPPGSSAPGVKQGRPALGVAPGRTGAAQSRDRELFGLDTEARDYDPGTDEFFIDPMMRRRLTGPVGNTDGKEQGVKAGINEKSSQQVHPTGHWSDRRLRLGDVDYLSLVTRGIDPNDGWALEEVSYELNGALEGTRTLSDDFDQNDFRDTVGPREFLVASFNRVDGVSADDFTIGGRVSSFDGGLGGIAEIDVTFAIRNTSGERVPSVPLQYGIEVNGEGRNWQVTSIGDFAPGQLRAPTVTLKARHDLAFQGGTLKLRGAVFVGETANWLSFTTQRSEIDDR
jgi:hypothetical protein